MADQIPFLDFVRVKHFGCIRDASLELTPLHALVGPNDAGKSTFLNAIGVAARARGDARSTRMVSCWVSYADGVGEAALLAGGSRP